MNNTENAMMHIETIQEMKKNDTPNLVYEILASVTQVYRTKEGLNIFTITDGDQTFKLIKFVPGSAVYPEIDKDSVALFKFKKHLHEGYLQGKLDEIKILSSEEESNFKKQLSLKKSSQYKPVNKDLLFNTPAFNAMKPKLNEVATLIRQAVIEHRPIVISHHNDVDGFTAGLLLEDAIKPLITKHFPLVKFMANFLTRYPSRTPYYDVIDATKDISMFLQNMERANTKPPLVLIVDNGSTPQDILAIRKIKLFGADVAVVDHHDPQGLDETGLSLVCKETVGHLNPHLVNVNQNISASLICYELANLINEFVKPNAHSALIGAVADRCEGSEVDQLISELKTTRDYYQELYLIGDYEIYQTKMFLPTSALLTFLRGDKLDELTKLYKPLLDEDKKSIVSTVNYYNNKKTIGKYQVNFLDGELTTLRGDYYQIGRLGAILNDSSEGNNIITCVYSNSFVVFRARQEADLFDINKLIPYLQEKLPFARISGGGHAVAGSIKLLPIAMKEVLKLTEEFISKL